MSLALSRALTGTLLGLHQFTSSPAVTTHDPSLALLLDSVRSTCPLHSQYKKAFLGLQAIVLLT